MRMVLSRRAEDGIVSVPWTYSLKWKIRYHRWLGDGINIRGLKRLGRAKDAC